MPLAWSVPTICGLPSYRRDCYQNLPHTALWDKNLAQSLCFPHDMMRVWCTHNINNGYAGRPVASLVQRRGWSCLEAWSASIQKLYSSWETTYFFRPLFSVISKSCRGNCTALPLFYASTHNTTLAFFWFLPGLAATGCHVCQNCISIQNASYWLQVFINALVHL